MGIQQMLMAGSSGNKTLSQIITDLGLTTNLKLCLDAGDANSYDPAVQTAKWLDTSGNGYDFYRGTSTGGDAAEPTFNGSAGGLSSAEYFSTDGADYFVYDSANEAWMENIHKNNATYSFLCVIYPGTLTSSRRIIGTHVADTLVGFDFGIFASGGSKFRLRVGDGSANELDINNTTSLSTTAWSVLQASISEATGAGGALLKVNGGSAQSFTSTYPSPSSGSSASTATVLAAPDGTRAFESGARLACLAMWEGTALTTTNLSDIYDAIKGRFGL